MTNFLSRGLSYIQRLYDFRGSQVTLDQFDLDTMIQPVHDVSRGLEVNSGLGGVSIAPGYHILGLVHNHTLAEAILTAFDPRQYIISNVAGGLAVPEPDAFDVWFLDAFVIGTTINSIAANAVVMAWYPGTFGGLLGPNAGQCLFFAGTRFAAPDVTGTTLLDCALGVTPAPVQAPLLLPRGTILSTQTASLVTGQQYLGVRCWAGPRGARPPGMA